MFRLISPSKIGFTLQNFFRIQYFNIFAFRTLFFMNKKQAFKECSRERALFRKFLADADNN